MIRFAAIAGATVLTACVWQTPAAAAPLSHAGLAAPSAAALAETVRYRGWRHGRRVGRPSIGRPYLRPYAWRYGAPYRYRRHGYVRPYPYSWRSYDYPAPLPAPLLGFGLGLPFIGGPLFW